MLELIWYDIIRVLYAYSVKRLWRTKMKKLFLSLTLLFTLLCISSCDFSFNNPDDPTPPDEFTLFSPEVKVSLVVGSDKSTEDDRRGYDMLRDAISSLLPGGYLIKTDDYNRSEQNPSEIVVGHTSREISELAYEYLDGKDAPGEGYSHFVIYCHDGAVAIAGDGQYAIEVAIEYFIDILVNGKKTLVLDYDLVEYVAFSVAAHEAELDERYDEAEALALAERWEALEEKIGSDAADAVKKLYNFYGTSWVTWLAKLYDPVTGCFYYANSSRDYYGFLPDAESTEQALGMLRSLGLFLRFNNSWETSLPADMREKCLAYIQSMQDEDDGYFYHPQWGKSINDSRKGRDLTSCLTLISRMGGKPLYKTPEERIYEGSASSVSTVIAAFMESDEHKSSIVLTESTIPAHLKSEQALINYIDNLNRRNDFYGIGHILSSQTSQIKAAGLADACLDYIDKFQNPRTGFWDDNGAITEGYENLSGITKLGALYGGLGRQMKYMDKIIDSAIDSLVNDGTPPRIYHIFNMWGGLSTAVGNVAATSDPNATDNTNISVVRQKIYERLPEMIDATIERLRKFRHSDGSFSACQGYSEPTTQGESVSKGFAEGDVNGTACGIEYLLRSLFGALGETEIPMFTYKDYRDFMEIIENAEPVQKKS